MKRLLAYLFIVLGLGLVFNSKSFSISFHDIESLKIGVIQKKTDKFKYVFASSSYKIGKFDKIGYYAGRVKIKKNGDLKGKIFFFPHKGYINPSSYECSLKTKLKNSDTGDIYLRCVNGWYKGNFINDNLKFQTTSVKLLDTNSGFENFFIDNLKLNFIPNYKDLKSTRDSFLNTKTQIAKAEPSQPQYVIDRNKHVDELIEKFAWQILNNWTIPAGFNYSKDSSIEVNIEINPIGRIKKFKIIDINKIQKDPLKKIVADSVISAIKLSEDLNVPDYNHSVFIYHHWWKELHLTFNPKKIDLNIAKIEPNQTQVKVCLYNDENIILISNKAKSNCKNEDGRGSKISYEKLLSKNPNMEICYRPNYKTVFAVKTIQRPGIYETQTNKNCNQIFEDAVVLNHLSDDNFSTTVKTKVVKVESTIIPKKKVKVAKVEDSTQEEFKPKKTNQDNEAPVIEIAEAITVNDSDYEFEGTVTDKSKQIFIEVDGRLVDVKKGKFTVKGYSPVDKEITIQAIDGYGNRSKPKIVKLIIDIKDTDIAEKLEPLNPSKIRAKVSKNRVALIIGIENYIEAPKANYANLDAKYFFDYARKGFGIKKQNINLLVDENATFVKTSKALTLWLKTKIKADQTDLVVFFAGHGLASSDGKELYLLPQDSDPNLLDITALSRTKLFQTIIDLKPKSVTMFLDTCYSGVSRDEQMLLASARPIRIVADEQEGIPDNFTIFTASQVEQISSGLKEANHGIFSYYLMKGLEGNADSNQDKKITNKELLAYMDENVSQKAAELGRQQNPSLSGDPDKVLMSYR